MTDPTILNSGVRLLVMLSSMPREVTSPFLDLVEEVGRIDRQRIGLAKIEPRGGEISVESCGLPFGADFDLLGFFWRKELSRPRRSDHRIETGGVGHIRRQAKAHVIDQARDVPGWSVAVQYGLCDMEAATVCGSINVNGAWVLDQEARHLTRRIRR